MMEKVFTGLAMAVLAGSMMRGAQMALPDNRPQMPKSPIERMTNWQNTRWMREGREPERAEFWANQPRRQ